MSTPNKADLLARLDTLTPQELKRFLVQELTRKKLGLVWEADLIERDSALNANLVFPKLDESLSRFAPGASSSGNLVIEGDNFDSLRLLKATHAGKIRVILIDPPYNTGNKDWVYNDDYVNKDDRWRHSKWLEFMYQRMTLARDLLTPDGVILICINDENRSRLELMMDEVMPGRRVGSFVWRCRSGANDEKEWFLSCDHEHVLCYANPGFSFAGHKKDWSKATDDGDIRGPWVDGPLNQGKDIRKRPESFYSIHNKKSGVYYPCDPDSVWRFSTASRAKGKKIRSSTMETLIDENRISWPANERIACYGSVLEIEKAIADGVAPHNLRVYSRIEQYECDVQAGSCDPRVLANIPPIEFWVGKQIGYGKPRYKRFTQDIKKKEKPVSTWILPSSTKKSEVELIESDDVDLLGSGFTSEGTGLLSKIIGNKDFPYPKPMSLITSLISQVTDPDDENIVLDFFAGSATTAHAVLALNEEDGGNRKFIMCSSREATPEEPNKNICRDVTARRLRSVIDGYNYATPKGLVEVDGLSGDFAYLTLDLIEEADLMFDASTHHAYALLCLRETGRAKRPPESPVWVVSASEDAAIAVCPSSTEEALSELLALGLARLVVYTDRPDSLRQSLEDAGVSAETHSLETALRFGQPARTFSAASPEVA